MSYFITGTDTGVGKTLVSCALLHGFAAQGNNVVGVKPVAAGCDDRDQNEDVLQLLAAGNVLAGIRTRQFPAQADHLHPKINQSFLQLIGLLVLHASGSEK